MTWYTDKTKTAAKRSKLYSLLNIPSDYIRPVNARVVNREDRDDYILERLLLDLNDGPWVPAYFTIPKNAKEGPMPAILYNHSHGGFYDLGKDELINGVIYLSDPPYATALARQGIAALAIDALNFGERRGRSESELFKELLWHGEVLWGHMVYDSLRAFEYLIRRPDVDPERVGTLGMSMGSTMSWWVAALETRIKLCIDICCLTDFQSLIDVRGLDGHNIYYYVPALLKHFTTGDINALIAPRPHLSLAGNLDRLTPPHGLDRVDQFLRQVYEDLHASERWCLKRYDVGHVETAAMRQAALDFLQQWL